MPRKCSPDGATTDWCGKHLIAAYYSFIHTTKGWKAESAWLADLHQTVYPRKWSPISCRSNAGQGKFSSQSLTFYDCATLPTDDDDDADDDDDDDDADDDDDVIYLIQLACVC